MIVGLSACNVILFLFQISACTPPLMSLFTDKWDPFPLGSACIQVQEFCVIIIGYLLLGSPFSCGAYFLFYGLNKMGYSRSLKEGDDRMRRQKDASNELSQAYELLLRMIVVKMELLLGHGGLMNEFI